MNYSYYTFRANMEI